MSEQGKAITLWVTDEQVRGLVAEMQMLARQRQGWYELPGMVLAVWVAWLPEEGREEAVGKVGN